MHFLVTIFILIAVAGCGSAIGSDFSNLGASSVDVDEMTGLHEPNDLPPTAIPPGRPWTEGFLEQAVGFYSRGWLLNSNKVPEWGEGFRLANPLSRAMYATFDLIAVVSSSTAAVRQQFEGSGLLKIGEASGLKGGKTLGHESHQNGLDIDVAYYRVGAMQPDDFDINVFGESMVYKGEVKKEFDYVRNYQLIKYLVSTGRVARIFVHGAIKRALCTYAKNLGEDVKVNDNLRLLRPYPGHGDHMHLRITCPKNSPRCRNQLPVGDFTGC